MDKSLLIQKQIKDNAEDLHSYVRDLKLWEEEMKRKDRQLSNEQTEEVLPPVRRTKLSNKSPGKKEDRSENRPTKKKLPCDYRSWDKFDVEKACEEIDNEDNKINNHEENYEEIAAQEEKYLKEKALYEKELGNKHVKASKWDEAIECYTKAIKAYPKDPVFFANRALCYLKKKKYEMVESDCTESLKLDPTYVKAMLRRSAAREALDRMEDACYDQRNALKLEPNNNQALKDLARLKEVTDKKKNMTANNRGTICKEPKVSISQKVTTQEKSKTVSLSQSVLEDQINKEVNLLNKGSEEFVAEPDWEPSSNIIQPIFKPPHMRSKKSLKQIEIFDVGPNTPLHVCARKLPKSENPSSLTNNPPTHPTTSREVEPCSPSVPTGKPRSKFTVATPAGSVPAPPSTSVQFYKAWSTIKPDPQLCYRFLKQIPGEALPDIFKESLESRMFSSIIETLATEFTSMDEPVLSYLKGMTRIQRFSTLALFMSTRDKSNLMKLFDYCLIKGECSSEEISELHRLYELS